MRVPISVQNLIWWGKADPIKDKKEFITAIFTRGEVKDMRWALQHYRRPALKDAVQNPLKGIWDPKSLSLLCGLLGVKLTKNKKKVAISSFWR